MSYYNKFPLLFKNNSTTPSPEKQYVPFPTPPTWGTAATHTPSGGKNWDNTALGGNLYATCNPGQDPNQSCTYTVGTASNPVRFKSSSASNKTIIGDGSVTNNPCFRGITNPRHVEVYDFIFYRNQGGMSWPGNSNDSNPSTVYLQNIESNLHSFASFWVNTAQGYYARVNSLFLRYNDLDGGVGDGTDGGEGLYIGHTTPSTRSVIYESKHKHLYGYRAGREGIQLTSVQDFEISNATIRNSGTWGSPAGNGQNRLFQFQFSFGKVIDSIFDGSPSAGEIQGTNMVFYNVYFKWMNTDKIYVGNSGDGLGGSETTVDDGPIIFDSCIFKTNTVELLNVANKKVDIIVRNCIISDTVTDIFDDSRGGGATNNLVDGGGNTFVPNSSIPDPQYEIEPEFDLHLTYVDTSAMVAAQGSHTNGRRYQAGSVFYMKTTRTTGNISDYIITSPGYVVANNWFYDKGLGYRCYPNVLQPTDIEIDNITIAEGEDINTVIGTISTVGGSSSYTYSILPYGYGSEDHASFNISGNNLRSSEVFDVESQDTYRVRIRSSSTSNSMRYIEKSFTITITAPISAATDIVLTPNTVNDGANIGSTVGVLSDNSYPSSTYSLVSGTGSTDNAKFSISGNNLLIQETPDHGTQDEYSIRVRATNTANGSLTYEEPLTVTVNEPAPLHMIINFGGDANTGISDPQVSGTESVWVLDQSTTNQTYNLSGGISVVLVNTGSNYWGDSGGDASGWVSLSGSGQYHNAVIGSWIYTSGARSAGCRIDGLDSGKTYTLKIGGFRPNSATTRHTNFTIGETTISRQNNWSGTDNQADNDSQFAFFNNISPNGSGQILLTVQTNGTMFGYLSVIEITEDV